MKGCGLWFAVVGDRIPMRTGAPRACELLDLSARVGFPRAVLAATWLEVGAAGAQPQLWHHLKHFSNVLILYLHFFGSKLKAKSHFKHCC